MRRLSPIAVVVFACGSAHASHTDMHVNCDVHSDYALSLTDKSLILTRESGAPKTVLMRQGRLFIDDKWVAVTPADSTRLADYERQARATMPLAREIGRDAAEIAFSAVGSVARELSDDPSKTDARLAEARKVLDRNLANAMSTTHFSGDEIGETIGKAVGDVMPMIVGDITGAALHAAFTGDTARFERMDNLDSRIDAIVEPRAAALERNANALCERMRGLDAIDDALDYRFAGKPLDLLRVEAAKHRDRNDRDDDRDRDREADEARDHARASR